MEKIACLKTLINSFLVSMLVIISIIPVSYEIGDPPTSTSRSIHLAESVQNYAPNYGAEYNWIDISGGTELITGLDNGYFTQALPFNFPFYDSSFSTVYISVNGYLSFYDSSPSDSMYDYLPSTNTDNRYLIAIFWQDLLTDEAGGVSGDIFVQSFGTYWVVSWVDMVHDYSPPDTVSVQIILFENGDILFNYDHIDYIYYPSYYAGCGLNYGWDNYYNAYYGLTSNTKNFAIQWAYSDPTGGVSGGDAEQVANYLSSVGVVSIIIIGVVAVMVKVLKKNDYARSRMSD